LTLAVIIEAEALQIAQLSPSKATFSINPSSTLSATQI
jgi:hypothetical protein